MTSYLVYLLVVPIFRPKTRSEPTISVCISAGSETALKVSSTEADGEGAVVVGNSAGAADSFDRHAANKSRLTTANEANFDFTFTR